MEVVILVPGIMGTELFIPSKNGEEKIWPPTATETKFGYKRTNKLQQADVRVGKIIRNVLCVDIYKPLYALLSDLGFKTEGGQKRMIDFPYDWRIDLFDTAAKLSDTLNEVVKAGATRISLVAHSMGGLICRLALEDPRYRGEPWFDQIAQLITIATPHLGAPLALGRVLGRDSDMGISGDDFRALSNNIAYPSAYQLLPAPGEQACWNQDDPELGSLDIYDPADGARLGLNPNMIGRARALHAILANGNVPAGKRYFYFAATGHRTVTRVNVRAKGTQAVDHAWTELTRTAEAGDGTVPLYSASPHGGQRQVVTNKHVTAFKGEAFRRVFVRLLGQTEGDALELSPDIKVELSVESSIVDAGQEIEVLLLLVDPAHGEAGLQTKVDGELVLHQAGEEETTDNKIQQRIPISYAGPQISHLRLYLAPIAEPGHYRLTFEGNIQLQEDVAFSVCVHLPVDEAH